MAEPRASRLVLGMVVALVCALVGGATVVAWHAGQAQEKTPLPPPAVTDRVRTGVVTETVLAQVEFEAKQEVHVAREGIHTATPAAAGATLREGQVLLVVNEQATLVGRGDFPLFRDLRFGTRGRDVAQVKAMLTRLGKPQSAGDVFDSVTGQALLELFRSSGYPLLLADGSEPTAATLVLPKGLIAFVKETPVVVAGDCGQLGAAAAEPCLVQTQTKAPVALVPISSGGRVEPGAAVVVEGADGKRTWKLGAKQRAKDEAHVRFNLTGPAGGPTRKQPARIVVRQSESGLVVPAVALRDVRGDSGGVERTEGGRADVTIMLCADGDCAVRSDHLKEGQEILLS